jgi:hypothetical protein
MKVVSLSALGTGRLYHPGNIPGTHFCYRLSQPQGHSAARTIMSMKHSNGTSEIEPATFRFLAQCLNQLRHLVPTWRKKIRDGCVQLGHEYAYGEKKKRDGCVQLGHEYTRTEHEGVRIR